MSAPNGMNQGAAAPYGIGGPLMPTAGQHQDLQYVWSLVEELSGLLQTNREQYQDLQASIARAQTRPETNGDSLNGDPNGASHETMGELREQLAQARKQFAGLELAHQEQGEVMEDYHKTLEVTMDKLRKYIFEHQQAIVAIHAHYSALLAQSRNETLQTQLTHQAWQGSFSRLSENVRLALNEREAEGLPYRRKIAALKEENRLLRAKVGWDPPSDDEDDERSNIMTDEHDR